MLALRDSLEGGFGAGSIDSLDAIVPPNDPIRARRPPVVPSTLNAAATPRATLSPARAALILPVAAQSTRADKPSGRGGGRGGGRSKLQNRLDGYKTNQRATALFTFHNKPSTVVVTGGIMSMHVASEMAKGLMEESDPNPLQEASVPGGWSPKSDWKGLDVQYDLYGGLQPQDYVSQSSSSSFSAGQTGQSILAQLASGQGQGQLAMMMMQQQQQAQQQQ